MQRSETELLLYQAAEAAEACRRCREAVLVPAGHRADQERERRSGAVSGLTQRHLTSAWTDRRRDDSSHTAIISCQRQSPSVYIQYYTSSYPKLYLMVGQKHCSIFYRLNANSLTCILVKL